MPELSIVTYNVWGYHTPAEYLKRKGENRGAMPESMAATCGPPESATQRRRAVLLRALEQADPDLIALAENVRRPDHPEQSHARQIARVTGMAVVEGTFHRDIDAQGRPFDVGVALLSHLPVERVEEFDLPYRAEECIEGSPKCLQVTLDFEEQPIHVWVTHLPSKNPETALNCAKALAGHAAEMGDEEPLLLCGDFNSEPDSPAMQPLLAPDSPPAMTDLWATLHPGEDGYTMYTPSPERRVDYLLLKDPTLGLTPVEIERIGDRPDENGFFPSDHCGLKAVLRSSWG